MNKNFDLKKNRNHLLFEEAKKVIVGGVNSPVRAFLSVGGNPLVVERGRGAYIWDANKTKYIDFVGSYGPLILGHAKKSVLKFVKKTLTKGSSFGATTEVEIKLCKFIIKNLPKMENIRMVNSGTEATMSAIRLARAVTKKELVVKFEGCYHGHADFFLIKAGSGSLTLGKPSSDGIPESLRKQTLVAKYNDSASVLKMFKKHGKNIAAVIVEPIAGNMGVIPAETNFLRFLRKITKENHSLLIFDEVMSGFRVGRRSSYDLYQIIPDIITLGKIIGGGFPVGAFAGSKKIFKHLAPSGGVYQAGTLSGNPVAMAAGLETLKIIERNKRFYEQLETYTRTLQEGIEESIEALKISASVGRVGSMMTLFFSAKKPNNYQDVILCNEKAYAQFFKEALKVGIYLPPSQYEAWFANEAMLCVNPKKIIRKIKTALQKTALHTRVFSR